MKKEVEVIYNILDGEKPSVNELKELLTPYKKGLIALAQINLEAGNIEYNAKRIVECINFAQKIGVETIIFPRLTLIGCALNDVVERHPIIIENNLKWLNEISKMTQNITAMVGFRDRKNSYAILKNGKILKVFDDNKKITINGIQITFSDCTDDKMPTIYINQVGGIDGTSYLGQSSVYDKKGKLFARAKSCEEQLLIFNLNKNLGKIYPSPQKTKRKAFSLNYEDEMEITYKTLIQGIKDYFKKTGFKRAVLGLSGGLDSTICASLLTNALGKENVLGVSLPSKITSKESKSDARELAKNLGINFIEVPIKDMVDAGKSTLYNKFDEIEKMWSARYKTSYTMDNIQARSRATILWGISNEFENCLPIATSDKSECYMGYATINGDMSGGFAPIGDVTKTKLFALARWLNKNVYKKEVIPKSIIEKRPGAELAINPKTGKPLLAEDALMPYEFLDEIIWRIENKQESYSYMMKSTFLYEKEHKITKTQKQEWLDKFYRRMSSAIFKSTIMPPIIKMPSTKPYAQPITSSKINYKGYVSKEIKEKIKSYIN